jgi:hypothetical protein
VNRERFWIEGSGGKWLASGFSSRISGNAPFRRILWFDPRLGFAAFQIVTES